ncbi:MAG: hypothetical protein PHV92_01995 [Candidatus Omnitrophica bacterium]|jgi:ketosteroid isomerase-like protein|nr:hypothetical protein [Candidatus Omnitrophota bacterium]MDD5518180.1 hypothetical protein [Candidatus Omnitrophota bacterium]
MRKIILVLAFALMIQPGYENIIVLAEEGMASVSPVTEEKDSAEIKKLLETYFSCVTRQDLDCTMSFVSKEFSAASQDKILDYDSLKFYFEDVFKKTVNRSFSNLNVLELTVSGDKATILIEYNLKFFSLDLAREAKMPRMAQYSLIKEGGAWKIVSLERFQNPNDV